MTSPFFALSFPHPSLRTTLHRQANLNLFRVYIWMITDVIFYSSVASGFDTRWRDTCLRFKYCEQRMHHDCDSKETHLGVITHGLTAYITRRYATRTRHMITLNDEQ
jgi:hypothetical protein